MPKYYNYFPYNNSNSYIIPKIKVNHSKNDKLAIPPKKLQKGYRQYISEGKKQVNNLLEILKHTIFVFKNNFKIIEIGCAAGRMMRHLNKFSKNCEIWGTDIDADCIYWCKQYLEPPFKFFTATNIPHLPFTDNYFDFIYLGSVFTHIDDLAEAWMLELKRLISSRGMIYITIHDYNTVKLLDTKYKDHWLSEYMNSHKIYKDNKNKFNMLVIGRNSDSMVFYDINYFTKILRDFNFEIVSITQEAYGYQTAVLIK